MNEVYAEFSLPVLESLDLSAAVRWSDYSTFGSETTGKVGLRWQPIEALAFRGTYSKGFRAPNLGELFGLTQFAATLIDPCGPTGTVVVNDADGLNTTPLETACRAQGVPSGFEQANTQITTFTGGNPGSGARELGQLHRGHRARCHLGGRVRDRLTFELTYFNHEIDSGIQARDIQALLNACLAAGGTDAELCSPFTRQQRQPATRLTTSWTTWAPSKPTASISRSTGAAPNGRGARLSAGLQATLVNDYTAMDTTGIVSQRTVGIEVSDSAIPELQANLQLGWDKGPGK